MGRRSKGDARDRAVMCSVRRGVCRCTGAAFQICRICMLAFIPFHAWNWDYEGIGTRHTISILLSSKTPSTGVRARARKLSVRVQGRLRW